MTLSFGLGQEIKSPVAASYVGFFVQYYLGFWYMGQTQFCEAKMAW